MSGLVQAQTTKSSLGKGPTIVRELVQRYRVCWEVWPDYLMVAGRKQQIGFQLELSGTHEMGVEHPTPGCNHCRKVFAALQVIAVHILPREERASVYDIESFEPAIHYAPIRGNRSEVSLTIRIAHRSHFNRPVDECEVRCLEEMKQRLRELGASEGRFRG